MEHDIHRIEEIQAEFERRGIRKVKLGGFDIDCILRGKYVSLEKFWSILKGGLGFCDVIFGWDSQDVLYDASVVTGWHTGYPDLAARVDTSTLRVIPWEPDTASFLIDFVDKDGNPFQPSPRQLLKRTLERVKAKGYVATTALEFEFFIYEENAVSAREKNFRRLTPLSPGMFGYSWLRTSQSSDLVHELIDALADFDVPVEGFHTETGPGVFEAAIRYTDALASADRGALFKTAVKEICHRHGLMACFMAKPANGLPGCSGHTHQSLWNADGTRNLFYDPSRPMGVSTLCESFLAGQLALMPEFCAFYAPNVNSYRRMLDGNWAPHAANWGIENRTCALRLIPGSESATRIEFRLTAADVNPYVATAAMLESGLYGIEHELALPPPVRGNAYAAKAPPLPTSLSRAVDALAESKRARELLGEGFVEHYQITRAWEVKQAEKAVTDWELARYLELA